MKLIFHIPVACLIMETRGKILPALLDDDELELELDDDHLDGDCLHQQARQGFHPSIHLSTPGLPYRQMDSQPQSRLR